MVVVFLTGRTKAPAVRYPVAVAPTTRHPASSGGGARSGTSREFDAGSSEPRQHKRYSRAVMAVQNGELVVVGQPDVT